MSAPRTLTRCAVLMHSFWLPLKEFGKLAFVATLSCCTGAPLKVKLVDGLSDSRLSNIRPAAGGCSCTSRTGVPVQLVRVLHSTRMTHQSASVDGPSPLHPARSLLGRLTWDVGTLSDSVLSNVPHLSTHRAKAFVWAFKGMIRRPSRQKCKLYCPLPRTF